MIPFTAVVVLLAVSSVTGLVHNNRVFSRSPSALFGGFFGGFKQFIASSTAGEYDEQSVKQQIEEQIANKPCVMYSFTTCPFCIKAKDVLINELGAKVEVVELDVDKKVGFPIRAELGKKTGRTSVPSVWIGGEFVGGFSDGPTEIKVKGSKISLAKGGVKELSQKGYLKSMLSTAGAL